MSEEFSHRINISADKNAPEEYRGQTKVIVLKPEKFTLVGKVLGEEFDGSIINLPGYKLKITGGSDSSGIPMRFDVHGPGKKRILLKKGPGFNPTRKGIRRRKIVRGNEITYDMTQINCVVTKFGKGQELFSSAEAEEEK